MKKFLYILLLVISAGVGVGCYFLFSNDKVENKKVGLNNHEEVKDDENQGFLLFEGIEMKRTVGVQELSHMEIGKETSEKYNINYYNYEDGKYVGEAEGVFGKETYEGLSIVENVSRFATNEDYDLIPREEKVIEEIPEELKDLENYSSVEISSIDLDGDDLSEYVVCYKNENGENEELKAESGVILYNSNYEEIKELVSLENGFWGDVKENDKKVFITLENVDYIDVDNDGIMEIVIEIPTYEGTKISVLKYENGNLDGETEIKASVLP